jgi:hypothetical protein
MLKSGAGVHDFTREERAKGGRARAEKLHERREAAQAFADEQLQAVLATAHGATIVRKALLTR